MTTREWIEFGFLDPVGDALAPIGAGLEGVKDALEVLQDSIAILVGIYVDIVKPTIAGALAVLIESVTIIRDTLIALLNTTGYYTYILPTPAKDYNFRDAMTLLAESVVDNYDLEKPSFGDAEVQVFSLTFALRAPSLSNLQSLFSLLKSLIKTPEFPRFNYELDRYGKKTDNTPLGEGQGAYPDWEKYDTILDAFPDVKSSIEDLKIMTDRIIEALSIGYAALDDLTEVVLQKAALLTVIINKINSFIQAIQLILALDFFPVLFIEGTYTGIGFASQIMQAIDEVPSMDYDPGNGSSPIPTSVADTTSLFSVCVVGPSVSNIAGLFNTGG